MYVRLIEKTLNNRGELLHISKVKAKNVNYERYVSLFPYDESIQTYWIKNNNSARGFKGLQYCPVIIIDIDNQNLEDALKSTIKLLYRFNDNFSLSSDDIKIYFSGNKGFHIGISEKILGGIVPQANISKLIGEFIKQITFGITNVDFSIYDNQRVIRAVNSLNTKSGLYKIPLTFTDLEDGIEHIKELAEMPRIIPQSKNVPTNDTLKNILLNITIANDDTGDGFSVTDGFFSPTDMGNRNNHLFKQACVLFRNSALKKKSIIEILSSINQASEKPILTEELNVIISSAENSVGTKDVEDDLVLKPFGGWVDEWYQSILPENNRLSLALPSFDKEMRGKLRGKLCAVLGKRGSKKSLYGQNIAYKNIFENKSRCIYSTMEMGSSELSNRFIDMCLTDTDYNGSFDLELKEKKETGYAKKFVENNITPLFSDNLLITQNNSLQTKHYDLLINRAILDYGSVDILVVDGLSMMGGRGNETELVNTHTKELKQLAIKHNIFVILITHVTKGTEKNTRDLTNFARGSEKIVDNADFSVTLSLCLNEFDLDGGSGEYRKDIGFIKLENKRGTGNVIDKIYYFDTKRLLIEESDINPKGFY